MAEAPDSKALSELVTKGQEAIATIQELLAQAKAAAAAADESQKQAAISFADLQAKITDLSNNASRALAASTQIQDTQAVIAAKSEHIQGAQDHADKVRSDLDKVLTAATQTANGIDGERQRAKAAAERAEEAPEIFAASDLRFQRAGSAPASVPASGLAALGKGARDQPDRGGGDDQEGGYRLELGRHQASES